MKEFAVLIVIFLMSGIATESFAQKKEKEVVCFRSNMDCVDCEKTLYEHLKFEKGVKNLKIDHASNTIMIEYTEKKNSEQGFSSAIEKKGYKAEKIDLETYNRIIDNIKKQGHNHQQEVHKQKN